jgi:hypothetical protein
MSSFQYGFFHTFFLFLTLPVSAKTKNLKSSAVYEKVYYFYFWSVRYEYINDKLMNN